MTQPANRPIPRVRKVLAVTDLSAHGDRAVAHAWSLLDRGGAVVLLHAIDTVELGVAPSGGSRKEKRTDLEAIEREARAHLERLVPRSDERGIETRVEVLRTTHVGDAICGAAETLGCDVVCMGTHGRSGVSELLTGSVAKAVVRRCRKPVLLVGPARESSEA